MRTLLLKMLKVLGISKIYHEVLLLMKFQQTKPQGKNMNINYYDL